MAFGAKEKYRKVPSVLTTIALSFKSVLDVA